MNAGTSSVAAVSQQAPGSLDLAGSWALADGQGGHATTIALPGDVHSALLAADLIPDPYVGRNEYDVRWVAERDWVLSREFELADPAVTLVIDSLDTVAEIRVNGERVLEAANAFRTWRADLSRAAVVGTNRIEIVIRSSVAAAEERQAAQPFYVPWHKGNCPIPNGNMLRKPQCDFGWDWNIALAPLGVHGAIRLEPTRQARLAGVTVAQAHGEGRVTLTLTARIEGEASGNGIEFAIGGQSVSTTVDGDRAVAEMVIEAPDLWWPAGVGAQTLHDLVVRMDDQILRRRVGLRAIDLVVQDDAAGTAFGFRVNGRDVFARGANWIPADALPGRITPEATRDLLQSAVDANMNMIRVWGGGRYEPDWFYDICDELGLLVWQDFMFACNLYPATPEFLAEVDAEVREAVLRIAHHACLALWCGDNELLGALNWFEESRNNRDRYLVAYDRLNRTVETALKETAPDANWWPSSPSPGYLNFGDAWHDDTSGDMHFWSVWHEGRDFEHYRDVSPRFCSEFGFQSYPSMEVIRSFAEPKDFNIAAPVLESHQKNAGGNARIAETMFRYFRFPHDFENFVYLSQVQQGLAIKTAVTHWRSLKPHCMGTLYWQLNDTWPVASWSSLDHGGGWKLLHHMARRFFAPVTVCVVPEAEGFVLKGVNDTGAPVSLSLEAIAVTPAGDERTLGSTEAVVSPDAAQALLSVPALAGDEVLVWTWRSSDGGAGMDLHAPKPFKSYDLQAPSISLDVREDGPLRHLTLRTETPAFFVALEADIPGRFSDNAFPLLAGRDAEITFAPRDGGRPPRFTVRDLYSATYGSP
ncbi:glycoside hydrolase family 2 protein [Oricola sp.]|uniref:beta-mannosidase n=1 Tax=Oricola sp. TaxID=1979950 RepID=UPI0025DBA55C|nr:glycoside hydrolase family 2 protein [Oricola sp.]MCI5078283.1 glycoside hydrolase family 2 protein [Oricola sp.]